MHGIEKAAKQGPVSRAAKLALQDEDYGSGRIEWRIGRGDFGQCMRSPDVNTNQDRVQLRRVVSQVTLIVRNGYSDRSLE